MKHKQASGDISDEADSPSWHALPAARCLDLLGSAEVGLSQAEAEARLTHYGPNRLPSRKRFSTSLLFVNQFRSPLIYLLLAATFVSLFVGRTIDALFIAIVLTFNAVVGTLQERRAETSMAALDRLIHHKARVRRDGRVTEVDAGELAPGDIVEIESGMAVPADLRLLSSSGLLADESMLSGESMPVQKAADLEVARGAGLADRPTMLHAGTT